MATSSDRPAWDGQRVGRTALGLGIAGLTLCAVGALAIPGTFYRSYLVAYAFWFNIGLGSLAILMLWHLTGGRWGQVLRRLLESSTRTLPLLLLLFLPLLMGMPYVYEWSLSDAAADPVLLHKSAYLNPTAFSIRLGVYFVLWIGLGFCLNAWSRRYDASHDPRFAGRMRALSGPGLVVYALSITLASIDWVMSLQPHWFSTIFGMVFAAAQLLTALAFMLIVLAQPASRQVWTGPVSPGTLRDLGNLLLMLVMFWAYVAFSQFLLIWYGNLPEENVWYLRRIAGGWQWIAVLLLGLQFFLPFLLLLLRQMKESVVGLARLAGLLLAMLFLNLFWQIIPAFEPAGLLAHWGDFLAALVAMLGVGGVWLAAFLWHLQRAPLPAVATAPDPEGASHG